MLFWSLDHPMAPLTNELHLAPRSPPLITLSWKSNPHLALRPQTSEKCQERFICISRSLFHNIVGVNDEASQSVFSHDLGNLPLPVISRILIEDIKKGIILSCSDGQLQDLADQIGHHVTAAAAL